MINKTFVHCPGIGPKTEERIKKSGIKSWQECLIKQDDLPFAGNKRQAFLRQIEKSIVALNKHDINYLVSALPTKEHWRILAEYFDKVTFFDIETTGLSSYDSLITVIVCYQAGRLHTFLYQENLDDFLNFVEESSLLVAFNGNSFDVPFIEKSFNIPDIGCPYIDLRWICYHAGYEGGLKSIEKQMHVHRPSRIESIDGFEAVSLFLDWQNGDDEARKKLVAYCQADVLSTYLVAHRLLDELGIQMPVVQQENIFDKITS
ncbi:ribonuclease H-like domain-containing protein [bacterium]|nr:ribonuclease H-like domain-containing protein [bacterium]